VSDALPLRPADPDPAGPPDAPRNYPAAGRPAIEPLLVSRRQLAALLAVSLASLDRLAAADRLPRPLRLAGSVRWRLEEVRAWVEAACPPRKEWEARQAQGRRPG
jgi:predicted DNA-binding transcriptional regulator AlpA